MGRTAQFDREELLLTAASVAAAGRPLTIQSLAEATGAPVGSIYHRFESREALLAEAWLLAVRHFQTAFLPPLAAAGTIEQGAEAALSVPRWTRANGKLAGLLVLRRQSDFLDDATPASLRREAASLKTAVTRELNAFAKRTRTPLINCRTALVGMPYGAMRQFLPGAVPAAIDGLVVAAYRAIMLAPST